MSRRQWTGCRRSITEPRSVPSTFACTSNVRATLKCVTFTAPLPFIKYLTTQSRATFVNQLIDRLATIRGVESVGGVTPLPLAGGEQYSVGSYGRIGEADDQYRANKADYKAVLPGYFEAMKIQLVAGRTLLRSDNEVEALDSEGTWSVEVMSVPSPLSPVPRGEGQGEGLFSSNDSMTH